MIDKQYDLCFNDILLIPQYSELDSRTTPSTATHLGWLKLETPIISAPMDSITGKHMLTTMAKLGGLGILSRHINLPDKEELATQIKEVQWARNQGANNIGCAIGVKENVGHKAQSLLNAGCNVICLDVAHGDHLKMYEAIETLAHLKEKYRFIIMAGNVCTYDAAFRFADCGVDAIKVGIGPGAACTTRLITGFGRGQLSAIQDCCVAVKNEFPEVSIIADGGLRNSGNMIKSFWGGADACMIGYMLAGTSDTPKIEGKRIYRGMSSRSVSGRSDIAPEGIEINVADKGETKKVIEEYVKGIKAGLAMGGAKNLNELRENVTHVIVSPLSMDETMPKTQ